MLSAQPMLQLSDFQSGHSFQAFQWSPRVIPIPNPELASEKTLKLRIGVGPSMGRGWGGCIEDLVPPREVVEGVVRGGSGFERCVAKDGKHGLEAGEVSTAGWDDMGRM